LSHCKCIVVASFEGIVPGRPLKKCPFFALNPDGTISAKCFVTYEQMDAEKFVYEKLTPRV